KTENTREAGYCLVAAAGRGDKILIAVILGSQEKRVWQDAKILLDYGFKTVDPVASGSRSPTIP
ncbi:MAG TPA: D-alanyl-D-alanine carboxypeptidase, partial [Candidatus Binatia bacterium]|nr:D-alanyl-D-alanine carboxypeptidase [Candidatus Binatia bacterium]